MKNYLSGKLLWLIVLIPITVSSQTQVKRKSTIAQCLFQKRLNNRLDIKRA